jgi:hypothetical protein
MRDFADNLMKGPEMKFRKAIRDNCDTVICAKMIELLHTQGIESAEAWLREMRKNDLYDEIEQQYLRSKKIIYIN